MWWMLSALAAGDCQARLDTWVDYRPQASDATWEAPGGWDKKRLAKFPTHRVAQAEQYKSAFKRYPAEVQDALLAGRIPNIVGLDEVALKLAWGEPDATWDTESGCRALLYGDHSPPMVVDSCDGELFERREISTSISCERLDGVVPRLGKRSLEGLERIEQVSVFAGVPGRFMDESLLEVAFGEVHEKRRRRRVYLDDSGYRPDLTVDLDDAGYAASWTFESGPREVHFVGESETVQPVTPEQPAPEPAPGGSAQLDATDPPEPKEVPRPRPHIQSSSSPDPVVRERPAAALADIPSGSHDFEGVCGSDRIKARIEIGSGSFEMSARLYRGKATSIEVFRTKGAVRGTEESLAFEGMGSGKLVGSDLTLILGPWPVAECSGAVLGGDGVTPGG